MSLEGILRNEDGRTASGFKKGQNLDSRINGRFNFEKKNCTMAVLSFIEFLDAFNKIKIIMLPELSLL